MHSLSTFFEEIVDKLSGFELVLILMTWASAVVGAVITFYVRTDHGQPRTWRGFLAFCFPMRILKSHSLFLDIGYAVSFRLLHPLLIAPFIIGQMVVAKYAYDGMQAVFGVTSPRAGLGWGLSALYLCSVVIVKDFIVFYGHYLEHRVPLLWEFHKVHHSATILVPLTNRRFHPVQVIFDEGSQALVVGLYLAISSYAFGIEVHEATVLGIDAYFLTQILCFYHLRHSHVYMTFGPLERVLMSPAQHHMHHSIEPRHWDRNFGLTLPIWDQLWGTHLVAEPARSFDLGLSGHEELEYQSVLRLYLLPFQKVWRRFVTGDKAPAVLPIASWESEPPVRSAGG